MTSFRQIEANRRNARKSTGPVTEDGKRRSRCNAVRHGLTAETVIGALEDAEDYQAFQAAIMADYDAQSAVERELEHVDFLRNRDSQNSLSVIQDPCWGCEASMDDQTLS